MIQEALANQELQWKEIRLKRGDFLSRAGEVEKYFYFVRSGALWAYTFIEDKECTIRFAYTGSIFTSLTSYLSGEAGEMYLEALRSSIVLQCSKSELEAYLLKDVERLVSYKKLLEELIIGCMERENDLLTQDPKKRIDRLIQRSPQLFQEVPHKYIAAYLRMSAETLSRLLKS
jgi:CRP-like cAMP-binding protein